MKIAFIGYGNMATALASKWHGKHELYFAGRDDSKAAAVAAQFGAMSGTMPDAVAFADIVVLATHNEQVLDAIEAAGGGPAFAGKTVIDINNPISLESFTTNLENGRSLTDAIKEVAPGADVIKTFNMAAASVWRDPDTTYDGRTMVTMYTADTASAVAIGAELIQDVGGDPLHVGDSAHAYQLEAAGALIIKQLFGDSPSTSIIQFIERR